MTPIQSLVLWIHKAILRLREAEALLVKMDSKSIRILPANSNIIRIERSSIDVSI